MRGGASRAWREIDHIGQTVRLLYVVILPPHKQTDILTAR